MSKREIEFKALMGKDEAIGHLENLVESLKAGKVVMERGKYFVSISPKEDVLLELECYQKRDKEKIAIELSWSPTPPHSNSKDLLNITSQEPLTNVSESETEQPETNQAEEVDKA